MPSGTAVKGKRKKKRSPLRWIIPIAALILVVAGAALWLNHTYLYIDGGFYRRDAAELDLREKSITVETYEKLRESFPESTILWNVPLGGSAFDCRAESVSLRSLAEEDLANLRYLPALRHIDATAVDLTTEQFETLRAAAPQCSVRWSIPVAGGRYASDAEGIILNTLSPADLDLFRYFDSLKVVDARACTDHDAILALRQALPDAEVYWQVTLSGNTYPQDAEELRVDDPSATAEEVAEALSYLPAAKLVSVPECTWTNEERISLRERFPGVAFRWPVTILGRRYQGDETALDFSGRALSEQELEELLTWGVYLPEVGRVDLTDCGLTLDQLLSVHECFPKAELAWHLTLYDREINSTDTEVYFKNMEWLDSADEMEKLIPIMPNLVKIDVDMNEANPELFESLYALNKRYENVRVIWTMHITYYTIRTDDLGFRASARYYGYFTEETIRWFKYCEDMICIDFGHKPYKDLSFLYDMPQLKYLILHRWKAKDLTPVGSLTNLVWLEMNAVEATSIAPLVTCTALTDLNITFMGYLTQEETYETLMAMPQLERVWFSRAQLTREQEAALQAAYPNTLYHAVYVWDQANEDPWRLDQDYYDHRDILGMYYMNGTGRINYKIIDGVRYDLDPEFIAQQGDASEDKFRSNQVRDIPG